MYKERIRGTIMEVIRYNRHYNGWGELTIDTTQGLERYRAKVDGFQAGQDTTITYIITEGSDFPRWVRWLFKIPEGGTFHKGLHSIESNGIRFVY